MCIRDRPLFAHSAGRLLALARGRPAHIAVNNRSVLLALFLCCRAERALRERRWMLRINGDLLAMLDLAVRKLGTCRVTVVGVKAHAD
eukprot:13057706-Alexandrium_andersonii.AAC.1